MNINTAKDYLEQHGYKLEQLYQYRSPEMSILHADACKEFLGGSISFHEYYCDMKRLEAVEVGGVAVGLYNNAFGFATEIRSSDDCLGYAIDLLKNEYVAIALVFETTHFVKHPYKLPVPAGKVYKIVSK